MPFGLAAWIEVVAWPPVVSDEEAGAIAFVVAFGEDAPAGVHRMMAAERRDNGGFRAEPDCAKKLARSGRLGILNVGKEQKSAWSLGISNDCVHFLKGFGQWSGQRVVTR